MEEESELAVELSSEVNTDNDPESDSDIGM